jgi:L-threonylcarbamoyladenylate synthase
MTLDAALPGEYPPIVSASAPEVAEALEAGEVVALPGVGGYVLAARAGSSETEARLARLAADPDGPHYAAGSADAVRDLTSRWSDDLSSLLDRCWPGPVEVFVPSARIDQAGPRAITVGIPDGRALRRLCRELGPWRVIPLGSTDAASTAEAFAGGVVAAVVEGGVRSGPPPTLVDATVTPPRILREGALPASFIEGTLLMSTRRRPWVRARRPPR